MGIAYRLRDPLVCCQPADAKTVFLRRRCGTADRAATGATAAADRTRDSGHSAAADCGIAARAAFSSRIAGRRGAWLCMREFRRTVAPTGTWADRHERTCACARFPDASRV